MEFWYGVVVTFYIIGLVPILFFMLLSTGLPGALEGRKFTAILLAWTWPIGLVVWCFWERYDETGLPPWKRRPRQKSNG